MKQDKSTAIILVVTNEKHNLEMLYTSLAQQTYLNFSLYFVDNNSNDGSVEYSKELNKRFNFNINYILLKENAGDAKGNTLGAYVASKDGHDYIFILNNDTELELHCLEELINLIESDKKIGVAGPIFFYWTNNKSRNKIQVYGANVNYKTQRTEIIAVDKIFEESKLPEVLECDYPTGGALFIKREVIEKLGKLFDERFFMYSNEIDFAYRVKKLGYKSVATTKAKVWHNHKFLTKKKKSYYLEYYLTARNKFLYYYKYKLYGRLIIGFVSDILRFPFKLFWFKKVCDWKLGLYYIGGIFAGIFNRQGKPKFLS